jgi:sarcosine oxidase subunit gamma
VSAPEPLHPLAGFARPGSHGTAGPRALRIELPAREIVQVTARRGREAELAQVLRAALGVELPNAGFARGAGEITAIWIQPGGWYLCAPRAVDDQSHGRTTLRVSGPTAREILSRGVRVDLHPRAFGPGRATTTMAGHITCLVHQTDDSAYELTVYSTLVATFFDWLVETAAEDGVVVA